MRELEKIRAPTGCPHIPQLATTTPGAAIESKRWSFIRCAPRNWQRMVTVCFSLSRPAFPQAKAQTACSASSCSDLGWEPRALGPTELSVCACASGCTLECPGQKTWAEAEAFCACLIIRW